MAPNTRSGSVDKGKGKARDPDSGSPSATASSARRTPSGGRSASPRNMRAQIAALESAQAAQQDKLDAIIQLLQNSAATVQPENRNRDAPIRSIEGSATPAAPAPFQPTALSPTPAVRETSLAPTDNGRGNYYYGKKALRFADKNSPVSYEAWKEQILDKFETDGASFPTQRSRIIYVFGQTEGEAMEHLFPRYTRDPDNTDPYQSYEEMFATLDSAYKNPHLVRDSRSAYKDLCMERTEGFQAFKTRFLRLANAGKIPQVDRFDDMYDKLPTSIQQQLLSWRAHLNGDFEQLCAQALSVDNELRRLNILRSQEREGRAANLRPLPPTTRAPTAPIANVRSPAKDTSAGFSLLSRPDPAAPTKPSGDKPPFAPSPAVKCYNCGTAGHMSRECPRPKRTPPTIADIEEDQIAEFEAGEYSDGESQADADPQLPGKGDA